MHDLILDAVLGKYTPDISHSTLVHLLDERSQNSSTLTPEKVSAIRKAIDSGNSHRLNPGFIETFCIEAFELLGVKFFPREKGCYELMYVPTEICRKDTRVKKSYRRICFDRKFHAEVILQGHPLLNAIVSLILERFSGSDTVDSENTPDSEISTPEGRKAIESAAMNAVMKIEESLGNFPADVSSDNLGYDIESITPEGASRFIEVKGRKKGASTVTLTVNEIHSALQNPRESILAIVEVDGDNTHTQYLTHSFTKEPDDSAVSVTFSISALVRNSECVYNDSEIR